MPSPVVDLSHHNPSPNWSTLKASGVVGVILKATQGVSYVDPTYSQRFDEALQAGLLVNSYHFLEAGNIDKQMDHLLRTVSPVRGERVVLDYEDYQAKTPSLDELCKAVTYLTTTRPDLQVTIYSGNLIKEKLGTKRRDELNATSLWIAQYTSAPEPSWPKQQWKYWSLWQWTDKETVPGISAPVDGNRWNGNSDSLVAFMSPAGSEPEPAPVDYPEVTLDVTVSMTEPVTLRLYINGEEVQVSAAPFMYPKGRPQ